MKRSISDDSVERTISACAWLVDIAQRSVDAHGWDPVIVRYLECLGQGAYQVQQRTIGGMGAMASMERSVTDVEMLASSGVGRGTDAPNDEAGHARHDKQIGGCVPHGTFLN